MSDALPRPRQVTLAAWMIMGGSALMLALVFERVAGLGSLETQRSIETFLSEPPGEGLGLDMQGVTTILRVLSMVAGACATAAAILGFHVLQRSRSARLGLAVLAIPLFVSGMAAGGFMPAVVVAAALMLWLQPARDWFDGIAPTPVERERPRSGEAAGSSVFQAPPVPPPAEPRAVTGFGSPTASSAPAAPDTAPRVPFPGVPFPAAVAPRPASLLWACVLTWTCCGLAILVMGMSALVLLAAPDLVFDELYRQNPDFRGQGVSESEIRVATLVLTGVLVVWGGAAIVFAAQAFRRVRWGRTALLASAATAGAVSLVGALVSIAMALPLVVCLVTVTLLVRPDVRAWFS